jgi:hypothetical protein
MLVGGQRDRGLKRRLAAVEVAGRLTGLAGLPRTPADGWFP